MEQEELEQAIKEGKIEEVKADTEKVDDSPVSTKPKLDEYIPLLETLRNAGLNFDSDYLNKANIGVYTPTADYHPATKKYVDDLVSKFANFTSDSDLAVNDAVAVRSTGTAGHVRATDSDFNDERTWNFIGFAKTAGTATFTTSVQYAGIVDGFSGLTAGATYYLNGTLGAISTTAGTYRYRVGVAISTTQLLIDKEDQEFVSTLPKTQGVQNMAQGTFNFAGGNGATQDLTVGFEPRVILFYWAVGSMTPVTGYASGTSSSHSESCLGGNYAPYGSAYGVAYFVDGGGYWVYNITTWGSTTTLTKTSSGSPSAWAPDCVWIAFK
jgi:hypothetical protein